MSVNDKKRGRPKQGKTKLSKESIVTCSRTLMEQTGKIPSIRQVANSLDVDPMAIYHYFANKNALLEAIAITLMESIHKPTGSADWKKELELLCQSYLTLLHTHSGLLETLLSMQSHGPAHVFIDRYQTIIAPLGLSDETAKNALDMLADYLHGFALATRCNTDSTLTMEALDGPLGFFIRGLEAEAQA